MIVVRRIRAKVSTVRTATWYESRASSILLLAEDHDKTAELIACCCQLGALYGGAREEVVQAMTRFGRYVGLAFQIADDLLDLLGDERQTGKSLGTDLEQQKLTLPLIRLLAGRGVRPVGGLPRGVARSLGAGKARRIRRCSRPGRRERWQRWSIWCIRQEA